MNMLRSRQSVRPALRSLFPTLLPWSRYSSAVTNLLAFGLVALAAMWIVHQGEYAIEYGRRFGTVMADSQHASMGSMGLVLAFGAGLLAFLTVIMLFQARRRWLRLLPGVPRRMLPHARVAFPPLAAGTVLRTAFALLLSQMALYAIQENLESLTIGAGLPGLDVLFAPQHITVVPLHVVAAVYGALLLCGIANLLHRTRRAVQVVRVLASMAVPRRRPVRRLAVLNRPVPSLRPLPGPGSLRAPPLTA